MHGDVSEWCSDWYGTYPTTPQTEPTGPGTSFRQSKVVRGSAYIYGAKGL